MIIDSKKIKMWSQIGPRATFGLACLDLSDKESIDYYNRLDTYAEALEFVGEYKESYSFFQKSLSMLKASKVDDKKENVLLNNLKSSLVLYNYNKGEALPKIKTALADVKKEKIDRYEELQSKAILFYAFPLLRSQKKYHKHTQRQ